jgi:xylan 1,4-beta-xylosidase
MNFIQNPILKGFNPDPSIIRVGADFFIATSTFEWYPGVQIHHSKDLQNWRLLTRPLRRNSQLNMSGESFSLGVWAPCLSYNNGTFYLVYTDAKESGNAHNYLVTTTNIEGDWSEPIYLHSRGFDPSLFHDDNGKKWLVSAWWESMPWSMSINRNTELKNAIYNKRLKKQYAKYNKKWDLFKGIILQEYDESQKKLVGESYKIFDKSIGITEGPHLYKKNGYYYLLTAEGGTSYGHAVTLARSKDLCGISEKYEIHPQNPILTARDTDCLLQKAGHADFVELENGDVYMVHLCSRPIDPKKYTGSVLGRETAIQKMKWCDDGWLRLEATGNTPLTKVPAPELKNVPKITKNIPAKITIRDDFDSLKLSLDYQWLKSDIIAEISSLTERRGFLRLKGKEKITSNFKQSLIARRQTSFIYTAQTALEFEPNDENQMAGLTAFYCNELFFYAYIGFDKNIGKFVSIMTNDLGNINLYATDPIAVKDAKRIYLRAEVNYENLQFYYSLDEKIWHKLGKKLNMLLLSDEHANGFTGAFIGLCCQDPATMTKHADFDYFEIFEIFEIFEQN